MRDNEFAEMIEQEVLSRYKKDINGNSLEVRRERDCIVLIDVQRKVIAKIPMENSGRETAIQISQNVEKRKRNSR